MSQPLRHWRIRVVFEPNRFAGEHLSGVHMQLKPVEAAPMAQPKTARKRAVKPGAQR